MWLIHTGTLKLKFFHDAKQVKYAILSHRWEEDEVTFDEFQVQSPGITVKQGYHKILKCCEEAQKRGLEWAWVDTCCIDKRSSAELQEAINSMFNWYRTATVCFAFLSDVDHDSPTRISLHELKTSAWFTRAWTLQELLAPVTLLFYDCRWHYLSDKADLSDELSTITNVPQHVLAFSFDQQAETCVAEIMSWAAGRQATRVEDIAYSLLGLFDVNMPMLYGEGEKAFIRLQEEILRRSNDQSLFAWHIDDAELGPFARSPDAFKRQSVLDNSYQLISRDTSIKWARKSSFAPRKPTKLTNDGVSVEVDLVALRPRIYLAGLNARAVDKREMNGQSCAWICLQRLDTTGRYCRITDPDTGSGACFFPCPGFYYTKRFQVRKIRLVERPQFLPLEQPAELTHMCHSTSLVEYKSIFYILETAKYEEATTPSSVQASFRLPTRNDLEPRSKMHEVNIWDYRFMREEQIFLYVKKFHIYRQSRDFSVSEVELDFNFDFHPFFRLHLASCGKTRDSCSIEYYYNDEIPTDAVLEEYLQGDRPYVDLTVSLHSLDALHERSERFQWCFYQDYVGDNDSIFFVLERDISGTWKWEISSEDLKRYHDP